MNSVAKVPKSDLRVPIKVWDLPVRLVHWLIVVCVLVSWISIEQGWLFVHKLSGYVIWSLLLFRFYWGLVGSTTARFANFVRGLGPVLRYARDLASNSPISTHAGHNPSGGWSSIVLYSLMGVQVLLGMFSVDVDGINSGPLASYIDFDSGRTVSRFHKITFNILLFFISLHVFAIIFYLFRRRENLILPMLHGKKRLPQESVPVMHFSSLRHAIVAMTTISLIVAVLINYIEF